MIRLTYIAAIFAFAAGSIQALPSFAGNGMVFVSVQDGSVSIWGHSTNLGAGDGSTSVKSESPRRINLPPARSAAVGSDHVLVLLQDGTVMGWGANSECEVGNGNPAKTLKRWERLESAKTAAAVTGLRGVKQIAASEHISGAVTEDGSVYIWGMGNNGLLGNGTVSPRGESVACAPVPQKVAGLSGIQMLSLSPAHAVAVGSDGSVYTWGLNSAGQLGDGTRKDRGRPAKVAGISNAVAAGAGYSNSVALLADGTVRTWGMNTNGALGDPETNPEQESKRYKTTPYNVPGIQGAVSLQVGGLFSFVRLKDGTLKCWGEGYHGTLGNGSYDGIFPAPQTPTGLGPVAAHYIANRTSFAVKADGSVYVWGPLRMLTREGNKENSTIPVRMAP